MYKLIFKKRAETDIENHQKSGNVPILRKLTSLLEEIKVHPRSGTGKPEQLRGNLSGKWSRRINSEHRLIYSIEEEKIIVEIISAKGHYDDR